MYKSKIVSYSFPFCRPCLWGLPVWSGSAGTRQTAFSPPTYWTHRSSPRLQPDTAPQRYDPWPGRKIQNLIDNRNTSARSQYFLAQGCHSTYWYRDRVPSNWESYRLFYVKLGKFKIHILYCQKSIYKSLHNLLLPSKN